MKSYIIHLIRNAASAENLEGRYVGHTDAPAAEQSIIQLMQLKKDMVFPPVEALFSSPLSRCKKTAEVLYPDNNVITIDGFIECNFGAFENKTAEELKNQPLFPRWLAGEKGVAPPFGEGSDAFAKRVCTTFEKVCEGLMKTGTHSAAIVTHGGVIMTLLTSYGIPELPMHEWLCPNGCGFTVLVDASLWMRMKKFEVYSEFPYTKEEITD